MRKTERDRKEGLRDKIILIVIVMIGLIANSLLLHCVGCFVSRHSCDVWPVVAPNGEIVPWQHVHRRLATTKSENVSTLTRAYVSNQRSLVLSKSCLSVRFKHLLYL